MHKQKKRKWGKGKQWEDVVLNSLRKLSQTRGIYFHWNHPTAVVVDGKLIFQRGGGDVPDISVTFEGRSFLLEAKDDTGAVTEGQGNHFDRHEGAGGVSAVLWRAPDRSRWVIPWAVLRGGGRQPRQGMGALWEGPEYGQPDYDWLTPLLRTQRSVQA